MLFVAMKDISPLDYNELIVNIIDIHVLVQYLQLTIYADAVRSRIEALDNGFESLVPRLLFLSEGGV